MIEQQVIQILSKHCEVPYVDIALHHRIQQDLGVDSLGVVEIVLDIENQFDCECPDHKIRSLRTVADVVEFVKNSA